jgi:hypothetical protein
MVTSPRRHRDDRIISRTLAYAIVTGLLVGVYAGIVLLATRAVSITAPVAVVQQALEPAHISVWLSEPW